MDKFKSGFVTIIGRPNVGKSTFMNSTLGRKIAIMSSKAQTTRNIIHGIYTTDKSQIVFVDTPGVHKPKHELGKYMISQALGSLRNVDCVLYMINAIEVCKKGDELIIDQLSKVKSPVILVVNKVDLAKDKNRLIENINDYKSRFNFSKVIEISATESYNIDILLDYINEMLPKGPKYYPEGQITNNPEKFIISEIIREKVLNNTRDEIPHSVAVIIDNLQKDDEYDHVINVSATIMVERDSQKGILIGKGGSMLKRIGTEARKEIKDVLGSKVYLELWVKVKKGWRNNISNLNNFGYKE